MIILPYELDLFRNMSIKIMLQNPGWNQGMYGKDSFLDYTLQLMLCQSFLVTFIGYHYRV